MSKYDQLKESLRSANPEERLTIIRHELLRSISVVRGYAALLKELEGSGEKELSKEFGEYVDKIVEAGDDLLEIADILT